MTDTVQDTTMPEGVSIDAIGGYCPVQAEGSIDEVPFYFRARGNRWSLSVGGSDLILNPDWSYGEPYGDTDFAAGWMDLDTARDFIAKGARLYRDATGRQAIS